jgi:hypothetical protein
MAKKKRKELNRIPMGIQIMGGTNVPICAYQVYRVTYDDGTVETDRGLTLHSAPGFNHRNNMTKRQRDAALDFRPDLTAAMQASQILLERIGNACWDLDTKGKK